MRKKKMLSILVILTLLMGVFCGGNPAYAKAKKTKVKTITLNSGYKMPVVGLGFVYRGSRCYIS